MKFKLSVSAEDAKLFDTGSYQRAFFLFLFPILIPTVPWALDLVVVLAFLILHFFFDDWRTLFKYAPWLPLAQAGLLTFSVRLANLYEHRGPTATELLLIFVAGVLVAILGTWLARNTVRDAIERDYGITPDKKT